MTVTAKTSMLIAVVVVAGQMIVKGSPCKVTFFICLFQYIKIIIIALYLLFVLSFSLLTHGYPSHIKKIFTKKL